MHNLGIQTGDNVNKTEQPVDALNPTAHQVGCNFSGDEGLRDYIAQKTRIHIFIK